MDIAIFSVPVFLTVAAYILGDVRKPQTKPCYESDCN
jgi:hypothetical protein